MGFNNKTELKMLIKKLQRINGSDIGFSIHEDEKGLQLFCDVPLSELEMPTGYSIDGYKVYKNDKEIAEFDVKTKGSGSQSEPVNVDNDLFKDDEEEKKQAAAEQSNDTKTGPSFRNFFSRINNAKDEDKTSEEELEAARDEYNSSEESASQIYNELEKLKIYVDESTKDKYDSLESLYYSSLVDSTKVSEDALRSSKKNLDDFILDSKSLLDLLKEKRFNDYLEKAELKYKEFNELSKYYNQEEVGLSVKYKDKLEDFKRDFDDNKKRNYIFNFDRLVDFYWELISTIESISERNILYIKKLVESINNGIEEIDKINIEDDFSKKYGRLLNSSELEDFNRIKEEYLEKYLEKNFNGYSSSQLETEIENIRRDSETLSSLSSTANFNKSKKDLLINSENTIKEIKKIIKDKNSKNYLSDYFIEKFEKDEDCFNRITSDYRSAEKSLIFGANIGLNELLEQAKTNKDNYEKELKAQIQALNNKDAEDKAKLEEENKKIIEEIESSEDIITEIKIITGNYNETKFLTKTEFDEVLEKQGLLEKKRTEIFDTTLSSVTKIKNRLNKLSEIAKANEKNQSEKVVVQEDPKVDDISETNKKVVLASMLVSDLKQVLEQKDNKKNSDILPEEDKVEESKTDISESNITLEEKIDSTNDITVLEAIKKEQLSILEIAKEKSSNILNDINYNQDNLLIDDLEDQLNFKISEIEEIKKKMISIKPIIKKIEIKISMLKAAEPYHQEQIEFWNSLSDDDLSPLNKLDDDTIKQFIKDYMAKLEAARKAQEDLENFASSYNIDNSSDNLKNYSKVYKN